MSFRVSVHLGISHFALTTGDPKKKNLGDRAKRKRNNHLAHTANSFCLIQSLIRSLIHWSLSFIKWDNNRTYLLELLEELIHIKYLE